MKTKVYISQPNRGWQEINIPERFRNHSYEALIKVVDQFINVQSCKGVLITENPNPFGKTLEEHKRMSA